MKPTLLLVVAVAALAVAGLGQASGRTALVVTPKCPHRAPAFTGGAGTATPFVHPGAAFLRLCRYYKNNWVDPLGLWRQNMLNDQPTISKLTRQLNKLKKPRMGIFCIKDDQSEVLLMFAYPDTLHSAVKSPERVVVKLSGCRFASNGKSVRSTTAKLHSELIKLSRP